MELVLYHVHRIQVRFILVLKSLYLFKPNAKFRNEKTTTTVP